MTLPPPTLAQERRLWRAGHRVVAGMDEVGRGAWAGPVSVGVAVVRCELRSRSVPRWLRDSKQLPEALRESVFDDLAAWCVDWSVGHAAHSECDAFGMTVALELAGRRALAGLEVAVDAVVVDGPRALVPPEIPAVPHTVPVIDGDARCVSVAAASVLAKVTRDRHMRAEAVHFPPYDLERNKGYPSLAHRVALTGYGLTSIHRRSWVFADSLPFGGRAPGPSVGDPCRTH